MIKLPFFNNKQKVWVGPLGIVAFMVFYMIPNHLSLFQVHYLHMFEFEKNISFMDWSVWFYMSDYLYIAVVFTLLKNFENMNKIFYAQMMMLVFTMLVFLFYPTAYPRPVVEYTGVTGAFVQLLHSLDTPGNAFPSVHVGMTFLAGFGFIKEQRRWLFLFMVWAIFISVSTLTLKQHYVLDVIYGFIMAVVFYYVGQRLISNRR